MQLASLSPELQSTLDNIFLVRIFQGIDPKIYGNGAMFQKTIDELNFLATEGITIDTANGNEQVFFTLVLLLGDNLGGHELLGFVN